MSGGHTVHKNISAAFWKVINGTKDYFTGLKKVLILEPSVISQKYALVISMPYDS